MLFRSSKAGSEGLDFKNVRQVHILDPWYNLFRNEQTIGRAIRNLSHCSLPYTKRNTQIFLYGTHLGDKNEYVVEDEAIDLYMYRNAEIKGVKIGKITRLLKENAIDCRLNFNQTHLFDSFLNKTVLQELSTGENIPDYRIGDKEYSIKCDFMRCDYQCNSEEVKEIDTSTYNQYFMKNNINTIINKIKDLYKKKYLYTKEDIVSEINYSKIYPITQINSALKKLINDKSEKLVDIIGRTGLLKNVNNLYIFNPEEIDIDAKLSNYHLRHPINIRPEKIQINLDNPIDQQNKIILQDQESLKQSLIYYLNNSFKEIFTEDILKTNHPNYFKSIVITMLKYYADLDEEILKELIVHHILENLSLNKLKLLLIIMNETISAEEKNRDPKKINLEILRIVSRYFQKFSFIENDEQIYILCKYSKNKNKLLENIELYKIVDNELINIEIKSRQENYITKKFKINKNNVNEYFGFKLLERLNSIFKIKNWKTGKKNTTGKKCDLFGPKIQQINLVNILYSDLINKRKNFYDIENNKIVSIMNKKIKNEKLNISENYKNLKYFYMLTSNVKIMTFLNLKPSFLCFQIEILFRYLNKMNINNTIWFFSNVESVIYNLNKFPQKNTISRKFIN